MPGAGELALAGSSKAECQSVDPDDRHVDQAAVWLARLLSDDATEQDQLYCLRWRRQDPGHERAWQRVCRVSGKFAEVPAGSDGARVLENARRATVSRRRFLEISALAGVGVTAIWLATPQVELGRKLMAEYRTGFGEMRSFTLEDGTQLVLNTNSAADVDFSSQERRIVLHDGEILIQTGPESPRRSFVVKTRFGQLEALGTEFSIRQYQDHARIAVLEGAVETRPGGGGTPARVEAGWQGYLDSSRAETVEPLHVGAVSWRQGRLVAEGMRLADFVEEIGRYRPGFTRYDDALADLTISGVFSLHDTDRALQSLSNSLPVSLSYRTAYWVKVIPAD